MRYLSWLMPVIFIALVGDALRSEEIRLINGHDVTAGTYKEVINLDSNGSGCTGTVVGPRTIITAAHCAVDGASAAFTIDGTTYSAKMKRSPLYGTGKDHDVAVGMTANDIKITPVSIGGTPSEGLSLILLGYGCTSIGGGGGSDGTLRWGDSTVIGFKDFDMVSRKAGGAALCFGDSGGPSFVTVDGKKKLIGINSKGNIKDTNYSLRLDIKESQDFLLDFATTNNVDICGIKGNCSGDGPPPPPPPQPPTCTLTSNPSSIKLGETIVLGLVITGKATEATVEGQDVPMPASTGTVKITPSAKGNFTATATVKNSAGANNCSAAYVVQENIIPNPPPSCTIAASPATVKVGEFVTLEMTTLGKADRAQIDGVDIAMPVGKRMIKATVKGNFSVTGNVSGPGGTGSCWASYNVDDGTPFPADTPNFALVPSYCGINTLPQSQVKQVCLAVVKRDASLSDLKMTDSLIITYTDGSKESLPIVNRKPRKHVGYDMRMQEDLILYGNGAVNAGNFLVLDTRTALLTRVSIRGGVVPSAIEGRSGKGWYFIVDKLSAFAVSFN